MHRRGLLVSYYYCFFRFFESKNRENSEEKMVIFVF